MFQNRTLEDTIYLWFGANDTAGSGNDGASAVYDVREGGAADSAAPVLSGSASLLSHANYPAGCYEVAVAATAANGFAANKDYGVFCTLAVDSQNPTGYIGGFRLAPVPANVTALVGVAQSAADLKDFADDGYDPATNKVQGVVLADTVTTLTGHTAQTGDAFARLGAPAGASHAVDVAAVKSDTGTALTRLGAPSNLGSGATVAANLVDIESQTDDIGAAGAGLTALPNVTVGDLTAAALGKFFTLDTTKIWSDAVAGSVLFELARRVVYQPSEGSPPSLSIQDVFNGLVSAVTEIDGKLSDPVFIEATVGDVTPSTTEFDSSSFSLPFAGDILNGCYLTFTNGNNKGLSRVIEDHAYSGTTTFTFAASEAWPTAPANGDAFIIMGRPGLTQPQVRTAVGLASANLDSQLGALPTAAEVVAALKADTEWMEMVANAGGGFSVTVPGAFPGSGSAVITNLADEPVLEFDLTFDANGFVSDRVRTGP